VPSRRCQIIGCVRASALQQRTATTVAALNVGPRRTANARSILCALSDRAGSQSDVRSDEHLKKRVLTGPSAISISIGSTIFRWNCRFLNQGNQLPCLPSDSVIRKPPSFTLLTDLIASSAGRPPRTTNLWPSEKIITVGKDPPKSASTPIVLSVEHAPALD
jgi:hypothetical protein